MSPLLLAVGGVDVPGAMAELMVQIAIAFVAAWGMGRLFEHWKQPAVLGELLAGVIIGPYLLGAAALPGFPHGVFPVGEGFPISLELYGVASMAAVILLFSVGLETDLETLRRFAAAGATVGLAGVFGSFVVGDLLTVWCAPTLLPGVADVGYMHPAALFMGVVCSSTSVGISARILSTAHRTDSPEGVTVLAGAVFDDILGILLLAVVLGVAKGGELGLVATAVIGLKAVGLWLGSTAAGLALAPLASRMLKRRLDHGTITHLALAMALILAGLFEKSGLAMIIGAYVVGLSISKTDLNLMIQDKLRVLERFFVPIFFCVMGMLVDLRAFMDPQLLAVGLALSLLGVLAKVLFCGGATLPFGFNLLGAARVGVGMAPRGEVTLIVAGVGLSTGAINDHVFSLAVILTAVTAVTTPPLLAWLIRSERSGLRHHPKVTEAISELSFQLPDAPTLQFVLMRLQEAFETEGWVVTRRDVPDCQFQFCREDSVILLNPTETCLAFRCRAHNVALVETLFIEELAELEHMMRRLQTLQTASLDRHRISAPAYSARDDGAMARLLVRDAVLPSLVATDLPGALGELLDALVAAGALPEARRNEAYAALLEREQDMTTCLQDGVAMPHARTEAVDRLCYTVARSVGGVDFGTAEGTCAHLIVMILVPARGRPSYLTLISQIASRLLSVPIREELLLADTRAAMIAALLPPANGPAK